MTSFGIRDDQSESDESESEESDEGSDVNTETFVDLMHKSQYNWFEFQEHVPDGNNLDRFFADITKHFNPEQVHETHHTVRSLILNPISMNRLNLLEL